jgi:hypothetical protein
MTQRFQMTRHPLTLGARLQQDPRGRLSREQRREPLATRDDPALGDRPVSMADAELTLAFVQIEPYRIHG